MHRLAVLLLCAWLAAACALPRPAAADRALGSALEGRWGGAHVDLQLSQSGGRIEYDCAEGTLDAAVVPAADGSFRVPGRHVHGHGGPARIGERLPSRPALYEGRVDGDRMQLRIRVDADTLGPYSVQRGAAAQLFKCL
ncbi:hypothetical protein ACFQZQ_05975 [Lysobacter koreensis]|uniref:Lipoprotein n=1 Tax=Lysobacter koreensis TaxID=266122 RepID=A0ABW2YLB6_9GAMM